MAHVFRHPKYYAELKKKLKQDILPRGNMSPPPGEECQASSVKPQASGVKPQAATKKTRDKKEES
jgi:hypothetical protein